MDELLWILVGALVVMMLYHLACRARSSIANTRAPVRIFIIARRGCPYCERMMEENPDLVQHMVFTNQGHATMDTARSISSQLDIHGVPAIVQQLPSGEMRLVHIGYSGKDDFRNKFSAANASIYP